MAEDLSTTLGGQVAPPIDPATGPAPAPYHVTVIDNTRVGNKMAQGLEPSSWDRILDAVGSTESAVTIPVQHFGRAAAKKLGASDQTASNVGAGLLPVLVVLAVVVVVVIAVKRRLFKKHISL